MRSLAPRDRWVAATVVVATFAYLASLPRYLGWADESYFLYEAKRIHDGEVMYRDIFQFITPLASYCMALLYWLFGTSIATARLAMAAIHALLCGLLFATSRAVGVRRSLALIAPLAFLSLCQPVWPFASPHWFSTATVAAVLALLVGDPAYGAEGPSSNRSAHADWRRHGAALGVLLGILIGVQQQKGLVIAASVAFTLAAHRLLDARFRRSDQVPLGARLAPVAAGALVVLVPLGLWLIATAGMQPVYDALVVFPLDSYRRGHFIRWGAAAPLTDSFAATTLPSVLRWSPVVVLVPLGRLLYAVATERDGMPVRQLIVLIVLAAASVLSIWYFPDLVHIAFIAPVFLVCAAETLEWLLRWSRPRLSFVLGLGAAVMLGFVLGHQLWRNAMAMRQEFTIPHETAFGRIDFARPWEPMFVDAVRARLDQVPGRELFSYPNVTSIYLTAGARNPTPYQYLLARVSPPAQIADAQRILSARRLPYIVVSPAIFTARDPLTVFITTHYESAPIQEIIDAGELPAFWLYRLETAP